MNKDVIKITVQTIFPTVLLLFVNAFFTLTFTGYFCICVLALLYSIKFKEVGQYLAWCVVFVSSIIITLNYLRPAEKDGIASYNNAAHNVLVLRGIESNNSIDLINSKNVDVALFDSDDYSGRLFAKANQNGKVDISCDLMSHPVYCWQDDGCVIVNKKSFPQFSKSLTLKKKSGELLTLSIEELRDSAQYIFSLYDKNVTLVDTASFSKKIKKGYPIYDILSSCDNDNILKKEFGPIFKDILLLRNKDEISDSSLFYITISDNMLSNYREDSLSIICDEDIVNIDCQPSKFQITKEQQMSIGVGSSETRPIKIQNISGIIRVVYDMPYMYNFPLDSIVIRGHTLAISSNAEDLLSSDVNSAFYFNIFNSLSNKNHFNGTISYQTSSSPQKLEADLIDNIAKNNYVKHDSLGYRLSTHNKTKWIVDVVDLKQNSPLTGEASWFSDWFIIGIIIVLSLFAIFSYFIIRNDESIHYSKANGVLNIWLFFISILTLRIYLMWRIAVFPPVESISKAEFTLYRLENALGNNSMIWTVGAIAIMIIATIILYVWEKKFKGKNIVNTICNKYSSTAFWITLSFAIIASVINKVIDLPNFFKVLINVVFPVFLFFVNEWRCIKGLSVIHRIASAVVVFGMLVIGDAGYAIMFLIFECLYFVILSIVYRHSVIDDNSIIRAVWRSCLVLSIIVFLITMFAPQIICYLYDSRDILGQNYVTISHIAFAIVGVVIVMLVLYSAKPLISATHKRYLKIGSAIFVVLLMFLGPWFFNYMGHFKYRSLVHTQNVGQIMEHEDVSTRNSARLLEASQNQWFLQYHNDLGKDRVLEDGVMHLYPHFKKGVSWNTQISDVICSRYIVGELSLIVPLALIILCFSLLYCTLKHDNESSVGYAFSVGVALLILIQMTFVWMANTNRMIFFGQDLPFLSHNAHSTMLMFAILLAFIMFALGNDGEYEQVVLSSGFKHFSKRPFKLLCVFYVLIFSVIFFTGNKYTSLYGGKAEAYSVGQAMDIAEADFMKINSILSKYKAKTKLKKNHNLKAEILPSIESEIKLTQEVDKLYEHKEISEFSYSLYKAFINNNSEENRVENVVHLRYYESSNTYQFALNNGFYCLKAPEMDKQDWKGDIYAYQNKESVITLQNPDQGNGIYIYSIPRTWLKPQDGEKAVFYNGNSVEAPINPVLFSEKGRIKVDVSTMLITESDVVRCRIKDKTYIYQVSGRKEDLLAKNMVVNGTLKFFYPLGEKFFWIKNFADYESNNKILGGDVDCPLTMDKDLTSDVHKILTSLSDVQSSVIAMDGFGNVRLMVDNNIHPDPNNESEIEKMVENSYLNPNYTSDSRIFGNMNLVHMIPGPASTLKPITYAAVTSKLNVIDWESLKLKAPDEKYVDGKYFKMDKFGPDYKYNRAPFQSIKDDEIGIDGWVNNDYYLSKSSNYYNALVTYLGYFKLKDYNNRNDVLRPISSPCNDYPIIKMRNQLYVLNKTPDKNRNECILDAGLKGNFQMTVSHDNKSEEKIIPEAFISPNTKQSNHPWLFPQMSSLYITESKDLSEQDRLKLYVLGSSPLKVTPIMMAEMYGRLFSMRPDYHAVVIENKTPFEENWSNPNMFTFYQKNIFEPMKHCATIGTAKMLTQVGDGSYYLYAKTGTLLGDKSNKDDKMLAVIVTNKDIATVETQDDYKFFVVYFRFKEVGDKMPSEVITIMNKIINSKSFQNYMLL